MPKWKQDPLADDLVVAKTPKWKQDPVIDEEPREQLKQQPGFFAETFGAAKERMVGRGERAFAPTELGKAALKATGATGKVGDWVEGVAGAPERVSRATQAGVATLFEPVGIASELVLKGLNRLVGGKPGEVVQKAVQAGAESKPGKKVIKAGAEWWEGLSDSEKANYGSLPDALDLIGLKAGSGAKQIAKAGAKKTKPIVRIGGEIIPLPKGSPTLQRISGSMPGGRGAKNKYAEQVHGAIMKEVKDIRGEGTAEEIAESLAGGAKAKLKAFKKDFDIKYGEIEAKGKAGVQRTGTVGLNPDDWAKKLRRSVNQSNKVFTNTKKGAGIADVPTGLGPETKARMKDVIDEINNLGKVSPAKRYEVFRRVKTRYAKFAYGYSKDKSFDEITATKGLYKNMVNLEREFIANQAEFFKADRDKLLKLFDDTNVYYGRTKPIRDFTKDVIGYNIEAGEKGHKTAKQALDGILSQSNRGEAVKLIGILDKQTKEHLQNGLLVKILDNSLIKEKTFISATKLEKQLDNIGRHHIAKIVGPEKAQRLEALVDGMKKVNASELKFADPTNKSGTAAAWMEKVFVLGAAGGAFLNPKTLGLTGGGAYTNRLVSHIIFNQPLSKVERAIGSGAKAFGKSAKEGALLRTGTIAKGAARGLEGDNNEDISEFLKRKMF